MAIPAGLFMHNLAIKMGILIGLALYAVGAFMFYPAAGVKKLFDVFIGIIYYCQRRPRFWKPLLILISLNLVIPLPQSRDLILHNHLME
jgi:hypothetical protein